MSTANFLQLQPAPPTLDELSTQVAAILHGIGQAPAAQPQLLTISASINAELDAILDAQDQFLAANPGVLMLLGRQVGDREARRGALLGGLRNLLGAFRGLLDFNFDLTTPEGVAAVIDKLVPLLALASGFGGAPIFGTLSTFLTKIRGNPQLLALIANVFKFAAAAQQTPTPAATPSIPAAQPTVAIPPVAIPGWGF